MDNAKTSKRVTRTRGKSTSAADTPASGSDAEMAPNLNGNKDGGGDEENAAPATESAPTKNAEPVKESGRPARKRKLTDLRSDEEESKEVEENDSLDIKEEPKTESATEDNDAIPEEDNANISAEFPVMDTSELNTSAEETATPGADSHAADSISNDLNIISSGGETYGKGKRARVPNKRYSDIIRSAGRTPRSEISHVTRTPRSAAVKNGEFPDDDLGEILREESELEAIKEANIPRKYVPVKRTKSSVDLSNPCFLKPFKYGWKRELVYRATYVDGKRNGDIYYYNPAGKKLRSMREVSEVLKNRELSMENFSFFKEPLGLNDTSKEIIREAKSDQPTAFQLNTKKHQKVMKLTKRLKEKEASPPPVSPKKVAKSSKASFKVKAPVKPQLLKKDKKEIKEAKVAATGPSTWHKKGKTNVGRKPCQPCSIRCEGKQGLVPCLQCRICLCLYHNECVGIASQVSVQGYVCKNCQLEQEPSDENSGTNLSAASQIPQPSAPFPPTLANVAPPAAVPPPNNASAADLSPNAKLKLNNNNTEQKSLVGSLTTWFPPSSTIQVSNNESDALTNVPRRPQLVEYIGNKKYVVVPRHNILSVRSPAQAEVANSVIFNSSAAGQCEREPEVEHPACPKSPTEHSASLPTQAENPDQGECKEEACSPSTAADEKAPEPAKAIPKPTLRYKEPPEERERAVVPRPGAPNLYMQNLQYGYTNLFCVFQYLKVQDLLRAGCVCTMWRDMSRYPALWRTVRMKNSQIYSFDGMANALRQHGTVHLDLRKMLLPSNATNDDIWPSFTNAIKKVESLRRIELCRCLASVVEDLARNNHNLEVINAVTIKCESMTFEPFESLTNLLDLRLKSTAGLTLTSDLSALKSLTKLKHLSITSIKDLNKLNIEVISELVNLEVLDLGECTDFPKHFGPDILSNLTKLEKLRLEKGQGECHAFEILDAVKGLSDLQQLELVNFDIKSGFDKSLGACYNIKKLLIIPTYISQSATTNHMVLGGVLRLQKTLSHFVWGVTLELLRVTELFVDQCEQPGKKEPREKGMNSGDSIPVLKPVPLQGIQQTEAPSSSDTPQVEILPLPNLQKLLLQNLPMTRVKILKIPFHATWRQSITDSVN